MTGGGLNQPRGSSPPAAVDWAPSAGRHPHLRVLSSLASKYYEKEALLMDPVDGPILASLLGKWPGALSFCWSRLTGTS